MADGCLFAGLSFACTQKWHDSKQPLSLMLPGQKPAVQLLQMPLMAEAIIWVKREWQLEASLQM